MEVLHLAPKLLPMPMSCHTELHLYTFSQSEGTCSFKKSLPFVGTTSVIGAQGGVVVGNTLYLGANTDTIYSVDLVTGEVSLFVFVRRR